MFSHHLLMEKVLTYYSYNTHSPYLNFFLKVYSSTIQYLSAVIYFMLFLIISSYSYKFPYYLLLPVYNFLVSIQVPVTSRGLKGSSRSQHVLDHSSEGVGKWKLTHSLDGFRQTFSLFFFCILHSLFSWWFPSLTFDVFFLTHFNYLFILSITAYHS